MKLDHIMAALAFGLGLSLPGESGAVVIYFEPLGGISIPNTYAGVSVDLESGASSTSLSGVTDGDVNFFQGGAGISNDGEASSNCAFGAVDELAREQDCSLRVAAYMKAFKSLESNYALRGVFS